MGPHNRVRLFPTPRYAWILLLCRFKGIPLRAFLNGPGLEGPGALPALPRRRPLLREGLETLSAVLRIPQHAPEEVGEGNAVLQGHLHTVEEIKFYDVSYIIGGAVCGNWWKGLRHEFPEGFVVVDIVGDEFDWKYETFNWDASKYN